MKSSGADAKDLYQDEREKLAEWALSGSLYALIDPYFEMPPGVRGLTLETRDTDPAFYEAIAWDQVTYEAPRLAKLDVAGLAWILNSLSTERWGAFIASDAGLEALARHFQKFVIARGPDANPYFLRFHDASVLEVLLSTWAPRERQIFFGPARAFGLPDLDSMNVRLITNPNPLKLSALPNPEECLLSLGRSQLQACGEAIDRDLAKIIAWHLRNYHARSVQHVPQPTLEKRVACAVVKARSHGLGAISDLAGYAALMFELAPNFDEHPSFQRILGDPTIAPETKMRKLAQAITDREWDEAQRLYDRGFWVAVGKKTAQTK